MTTPTAEAYTGSVDKLKAAGLDPIGLFYLEVQNVRAVEAEQFYDAPWMNRVTGDKYPGIEFTFSFNERALYNEEGKLEGTEEMNGKRTRRQTIDPENEADLQRLFSLFKLVTGRVPEGQYNPDTGEHEVNYLALAEETKGGGGWNSITHSDPDKSKDGSIFANLGRKFQKAPWNSFGARKNSSASPTTTEE